MTFGQKRNLDKVKRKMIFEKTVFYDIPIFIYNTNKREWNRKVSIKVKEVLELAQSKGCTLAAGEGGIDRIVRFVDCMEIPDMKAWMRPNVLYITTGYAYSDTKEEIMNLIRNLYEAKAAALATKYRYIGVFG